MKTRTAVLIVGIGAGLAVPLLRKGIKPLGAYLIGGGIIAYETACELAEFSGDLFAYSVKNIGKLLHQNLAEEVAAERSSPESF